MMKLQTAGRAGVHSKGRLQRLSLALTICLTFVGAIVPSLADSGDLDHAQDRLQEVQQQLDADLANAGSLSDRIDALNGYLMKIQIRLNELHTSMGEIEARVRAARSRIADTQQQMSKIKSLAKAQAVQLYKGGNIGELETLLTSASIADLDSRALMLSVVSKKSTGALIRYGRLKTSIQLQNKELFARKRELEVKAGEQEAALAELEEKRADIAVALEKVHGKIVQEKDTQAKLADAAAQLERELQAPSVVSAPLVSSASTSTGGFIWPVNGIITSPYGPRGGGFHPGLDIDCYTGQAIAASKAGTVISAAYSDGYGNLVVIDHGGGYATAYAHLSAFSTSSGASVAQGQTIGDCGSTGYSTGDHLHFEVRVNGATQDPLDYLP